MRCDNILTDGIIQEVFSKYFENIGMLPMTGDDLRDLQQELIEKIKQRINELNDYKFDEDNPEYCHRVISLRQIQINELKRLIGDNQ